MSLTTQQRWETYTALLNSDKGRPFVDDFLELTGVFKQSFVPGDPMATAFNEGKRFAGNLLLQLLNQSPAMVSKLSQQTLEHERLAQMFQQEEF